jgi:hypothetical protein
VRRQRRVSFLACNGLLLQLDKGIDFRGRARILASISGLPALTGSPLHIRVLPKLTAHRGQLLSQYPDRGTPVHAASFIRRREIVLESELLIKPDLPLILVHEIFHFVWVRLGNRKRTEFTALIAKERQANARGELGESAEVRKQIAPDSRDYICESFCDTAAWLYVRVRRRRRFMLARRWRDGRRSWFAKTFSSPVVY